jgi:hypothetical protein
MVNVHYQVVQAAAGFVSVFITGVQEESMIGDLDTMLSQHPPKIVRVASECQECQSISTKFANHQTLYQASHNEIIC